MRIVPITPIMLGTFLLRSTPSVMNLLPLATINSRDQWIGRYINPQEKQMWQTHLNLPALAGAGVRAMVARRAASPRGTPISLLRPTATGRLRARRAGGHWRLTTTGRTAAAEQGSGRVSCPPFPTATDPTWGPTHDHTWRCHRSS